MDPLLYMANDGSNLTNSSGEIGADTHGVAGRVPAARAGGEMEGKPTGNSAAMVRALRLALVLGGSAVPAKVAYTGPHAGEIIGGEREQDRPSNYLGPTV